jgi:hypothetical protein
METGRERLGRIAGGGRCRAAAALVIAAALVLAAAAAPPAAALNPDLEKALDASTYVYVATERKGGAFGTPAEIWFLYHQGAVWVASPTTTWRVKRLRAGRPKARIAVGTSGGPSFTATGAIVADRAVYDLMFETFARKYPERWPGYEQRFRQGLADGTRVLIRYRPLD